MKLSNEQIEKLQRSGVKLVYLFGSQAEGKEMMHSDIDIGIVLDYVTGRKAVLTNLYNLLYDIFSCIYPGNNIDIVFLNRASQELRFDVVAHGKIIYASSITDQLDFEETTMISYADFRPLLNEFNKVISERII